MTRRWQCEVTWKMFIYFLNAPDSDEMRKSHKSIKSALDNNIIKSFISKGVTAHTKCYEIKKFFYYYHVFGPLLFGESVMMWQDRKWDVQLWKVTIFFGYSFVNLFKEVVFHKLEQLFNIKSSNVLA